LSPSDRSVAPTAPARLRSYYELTKPGIAVFAMMTAGVAHYVGAAGRVAPSALIHTLVGTFVATAGALTLNQYLEREVDTRMERTRVRPIPSGRVSPGGALAFGLILVAAGVLYLWLAVGALPALLTLAAAAAYDLVYTPLKSRTFAAILVGAVPGSMPALIGWSAATGDLAAGALVLFAIGFLWQLPHVLSLAWLLKEDYERAGFHMSPPNDPTGRIAGRHMVAYAALLVPVSLLPTLFGMTGIVYLGGAALLGGGFLAVSVRARRGMERPAVRNVFLGSLLYPPLLFGLMILDTVRV